MYDRIIHWYDFVLGTRPWRIAETSGVTVCANTLTIFRTAVKTLAAACRKAHQELVTAHKGRIKALEQSEIAKKAKLKDNR